MPVLLEMCVLDDIADNMWKYVKGLWTFVFFFPDRRAVSRLPIINVLNWIHKNANLTQNAGGKACAAPESIYLQ